MELYSGNADVAAFRHVDLNTRPEKTTMESQLPNIVDVTSIIGSDADASRVYLSGQNKEIAGTAAVAVSYDSGQSYSQLGAYDSAWGFARLAVANGDANNVVAATHTGGLRYSLDGGSSWNRSSGAPDTAQDLGTGALFQVREALVADGASNNTFFLYRSWAGLVNPGTPDEYPNFTSGEIYRSDDGGANWFRTSTDVPGTFLQNHEIAAMPGRAGDLWLAVENEPLRRSTDGGSSWNPVAGFEASTMVAFGKNKAGASGSAIYVHGKRAGDTEYAYYGSTDDGASWARVNPAGVPIGNAPQVMTASQQDYGVLFIGTDGRGLFKGEVNHSGGAIIGDNAPGAAAVVVAAGGGAVAAGTERTCSPTPASRTA